MDESHKSNIKRKGQDTKNINEIIPFIHSSRTGKATDGVRSQFPGYLWGGARG